MTIQISCSYCGGKLRAGDVALEHASLNVEAFKRLFSNLGFTVEDTGQNIDIYCKKSCAKGTTKI